MNRAIRWRSDAATRGFDMLFAVIGLLCAVPMFVVLLPLLRFTGEGEVFYRQRRIGRGGRAFGMLKFATMLKTSAAMGAGELTLSADPRVLPLGRFLRKSKLNELPQLLNVLFGDMSFIGPRPQTERYFQAYRVEDRDLIMLVRPGLSGVGSIVFRDEEAIFARVADPLVFDRDVVMPYKGGIESWFVLRRSVGLYLELILITIAVIVFPRSVWRTRLLSRLPPPPAVLDEFL
jgi:lipopolysaccharide/colanic/teichoic acid biosynthesis glycosyltransferase